MLDSNSSDTACNPEVRITIFPDVSAQRADRKTCAWRDVVRTLETPSEYASKQACPLLKLGEFGNQRTAKGSLRSDDNLIAVYGVVVDYDGEKVTVDEAATRLAASGVEAVIYTSPRHTPDAPRWRAVAPLSQAHGRDEHGLMVALLNDALGGILAPESFTASQTYYFGRVKGTPYEVRHVRGMPIDELDLVLTPRYAEADKSVLTQRVREREAFDLDREAALANVTDDTIADLLSAVQYMGAKQPEKFDDYFFWAHKFGQAVKSLEQAGRSDEARELWHLGSAFSPRYDAEEAEAKYATLNPNRITYKSIFEWAAAMHWPNPRSAEALKAGATATTRLDRTDAGNVALLASVVDGNLRYVPERRTWLSWNGERWEPDTYGTAAQAAALQVAEHYHRQAAEIRKQAKASTLDAKEQKRIEQAAENVEKWAGHCRNKRTLDNMLNLAKSDDRFTLAVSELDRDPWLFGVANGVVDLRTGELRAAGRDDYVTRCSPVAFNPDAKAPRWLQFIEEITANPVPGNPARYTPRPALASYLQRAISYSLTGSTSEHKMFIAVGDGSNGKNVLLDRLQELAGDYCQTIPPEALMATRHDADAERASPTAATLAGTRAAISSESKDGARLDVALVKRHTGGGFMTARFLRENTFRFEITHKLWLMTNHRPALDHMDDAMRGRLHLIPFDMKWNRPGHPERDPNLPDGDKDLPAKLKAEAEGILAWLVAGAVRYVNDGLEPPAEVVNMTRDFFKEQDCFARWLARYESCDKGQGVGAQALYGQFTSWRKEEGESGGPATQKAFSAKLAEAGVVKHETGAANTWLLRFKEVDL